MPQQPQLPVTTDDLLKMIGELTVTRRHQAALIASQSARIAELEASQVTTTTFDAG